MKLSAVEGLNIFFSGNPLCRLNTPSELKPDSACIIQLSDTSSGYRGAAWRTLCSGASWRVKESKSHK